MKVWAFLRVFEILIEEGEDGGKKRMVGCVFGLVKRKEKEVNMFKSI